MKPPPAAPAEDPVAAAALDAPATPGASGGKKSYPNPTTYRGSKFATEVNDFLDQAGAPDGLAAKPATRVYVTECAMATAEAWGLKADGREQPIHPGYLLLIAVLAYAGIVCLYHFVLKDKTPPAAPDPAVEAERRSRLARL